MKKIPILDQTHGLTPLQKFEFFPLFRKEICMSKKAFFSIKSISKQYFQAYFAQKQSMEKIPILKKKTWTNPFQKFEFCHLFKKTILILKNSFFSLQSISKQYFKAYFSQKQSMEKIPIFDQNHGLTPLQKFEFLPLFRKDIFMLKKVFFSILSISKKYFQAHFPQKQSMEKIPIFDQNHGLTPLQKFEFLPLF